MNINKRKLKDDLVLYSVLPLMIYLVTASMVGILAILGLDTMQKGAPHAFDKINGGYDLLWDILITWPYIILGQFLFFIYLYLKYFQKPKKTYPKGYKIPKRSLKERLKA